MHSVQYLSHSALVRRDEECSRVDDVLGLLNRPAPLQESESVVKEEDAAQETNTHKISKEQKTKEKCLERHPSSPALADAPHLIEEAAKAANDKSRGMKERIEAGKTALSLFEDARATLGLADENMTDREIGQAQDTDQANGFQNDVTRHEDIERLVSFEHSYPPEHWDKLIKDSAKQTVDGSESAKRGKKLLGNLENEEAWLSSTQTVRAAFSVPTKQER